MTYQLEFLVYEFFKVAIEKQNVNYTNIKYFPAKGGYGLHQKTEIRI